MIIIALLEFMTEQLIVKYNLNEVEGISVYHRETKSKNVRYFLHQNFAVHKMGKIQASHLS